MRVVLKKELNLPIIEITDINARLDGGDVLFTGNYVFYYYTIMSFSLSIRTKYLECMFRKLYNNIRHKAA